ncbi:zinc ribbon domain-containing protein [uncultured Brachyspira sp.]|uniref:zinc ribbon domain-containing protein n=1 Tax=uncultured Brachyspira sp. TaxID=221953 RepID=UPI00320A104D
MFCANCGKEIKEGMNFCSSCESKIELVNKEEAINDNVNNAENNANIDIKKEEKKENDTIDNSIYSTSDFYISIKGIKSRFDHGYNNMQFFSIFYQYLFG